MDLHWRHLRTLLEAALPQQLGSHAGAARFPAANSLATVPHDVSHCNYAIHSKLFVISLELLRNFANNRSAYFAKYHERNTFSLPPIQCTHQLVKLEQLISQFFKAFLVLLVHLFSLKITTMNRPRILGLKREQPNTRCTKNMNFALFFRRGEAVSIIDV